MAKDTEVEKKTESRERSNDRNPRPDRTEFERKLAELREEFSAAQEAAKKARAAAGQARSDGSQDSSTWNQLQEELKQVKKEREQARQGSSGTEGEIKRLESRVQQQLKQVTTMRPKTGGPKSAAELDSLISRLEKSLESGDLSIKKESETLRETRRLKQLRQQFVEIDSIQAQIDQDRAEIKRLNGTIDHSAIKAAQAKIAEVNSKLDTLRNDRQSRRHATDKVYNDLRAAQAKVDEVRKRLDAHRDEFTAKLNEYREKAKQQRLARLAEERTVKAEAAKQKKLADAQAKVDAAKLPAFDGQIAKAVSLVAYFDPSYNPDGETGKANGANAHLHVQREARKVEELPANAKIVTKSDSPERPLSRKQLKLKAKSKNDAEKSANGDRKLQLDMSIIEDLASLNITMPTSASDIPDTKAKLLEKIEFYKANNERVTKERIERAQSEYEKLAAKAEAEAKAEVAGESAQESGAESETPKAQSEEAVKAKAETTVTA